MQVAVRCPYKTAQILIAIAVSIPSTSALAQVVEDDSLSASDGFAGQEFGHAVALHGGQLAVGARFDNENGTDSGAAYLFGLSTGVQQRKLLADDASAGDEFGFSIASAGGLVAVGAPHAVSAETASGAVYVFDATTGDQLHKLLPDDGSEGDEFGCAVAIDGNIVAVGAQRDDDDGDSSGSVYLFNATTGQQIDKLKANDAGANNTFGEALAMEGDILAVGAHGHSHDGLLLFPGAAYLFDVTTGNQLAELNADDAQSFDFFGSAIDIDRGLVAVGAWSKSIVFDHSGAAYVFDAATGNQLGQRLAPADGRDRQNFGLSLAIHAGVVAVGAPGDVDNGPDAGAAYLFDATTGSEIGKLLASDGSTFDEFGGSLIYRDDVIAVGAFSNGSSPGSAYLFRRGLFSDGFETGDTLSWSSVVP